MILTEEEAKTKRCQESFGEGNLGSGFLEGRAIQMGVAVYASSPITCIGSYCMAWRIQQAAVPSRQDIGCTHDSNPPTHGSGWTFVEGSETGSSWVRTLPGQPATGYCGKAGRPPGVEP